MARPARYNAEFFYHPANLRDDRRVKAVRARFGPTGYAVLVMLLETLTNADYTQIDTSEIELELLAGDYGVSVTEIHSLIQLCEKVGYFARTEAGLLICPDLNKALEQVFEKRNRSRNAANNDRNTPIPQSDVVSATETPQSVTETPQSIVNESIVNESKEIKNTVVPASAETTGVIVTGLGEITTKNIALYVSDVSDPVRVKFLNESRGREFPSIIEFQRSVRAFRSQEKPIQTHMAKPTLEELTVYMNEKGMSPKEADKFFNFYESNGWMVGKKPMQKWKAAVANWSNSPFRQHEPVVAVRQPTNNQTYQDLLKPEYRNAH